MVTKKIINKIFITAVTFMVLFSSLTLQVFANENLQVINDQVYHIDLNIEGSDSTQNNIANYEDGDTEYTLKSDGTAILKYKLKTISGYIGFKKVNYDSNEYYYRLNETDEWMVANAVWTGSTRAEYVEFELESTDISGFYIKSDIYIRGESDVNKTIEGFLSFDVKKASVTMTASEPVFKEQSTITLSATPTESSIYYTINGETKLYTEPFEIYETTKIEAYAQYDGYVSEEPVVNTYRKSDVDGFGIYNIQYDEGVHPITLNAKTAGGTSASSYADFINVNAFLIVDENNEARVRVELLKSSMNKVWDFVGYVENYKYFDINDQLVDVDILEYFDEESLINEGTYPPKVIEFPLVYKRNSLIEMNAQAAMVSDNSIMPQYTSDHDFDLWIEEFSVSTDSDETPKPEIEDTGFLFGSEEVELKAGKYTIDAQFVKANDFNELSMSNDAVYGDYILEVKKDGTATVSMNFGSMNYGGIDSYVETVRYYASDTINPNYLEEAIVNSKTEANTPNNVTFNISNKALDGMYVNFDVLYIHTGLDAYLTLDYTSVESYVETNNFLFGSEEVELKEGLYTIDAQFVKANDYNELSMSNDAVYGDYILEVKKDGTATVSMNFGSMNYGGIDSYVETVRYYTSDTNNPNYLEDAIVNSKTAANTPNNVTFKISNKALDGMYVNFDVLYIHTGLDAYLTLDYTSAETLSTAPLTVEYENQYNTEQGGNFVFRILADFDSFVELRLNNSVVSREHYSIKEGSIIVEVEESFMKTLTNGSHTFAAHTTEGIATVSFDINNNESVYTNDTTEIYYFTNLTVLSLFIAIVTFRKKIVL